MTVTQMKEALSLTLLSQGEEEREIHGVYCCDLLSIAMGRAPADSAWVTVMGNLNTIAVAALTDVACVILAEGMTLDAAALQKAQEKKIWVLATASPVFEAANAVHGLL